MSKSTQIVDFTWLARPSPRVAPDLLGCTLVRRFPDGQVVRGTIVEAEAYGPEDPACHAYQRRSTRNEVMFGPAGVSYVYLIYGMYHCFNVVTEGEGVASAVLIRALQLNSIPQGISWKSEKERSRLAAGPGKLCQVLQIDRSLNGVPLQPDQPLWLEHRSQEFQAGVDRGAIAFVQTTRIGITKGVELPWRWYVENCAAVSKL